MPSLRGTSLRHFFSLVICTRNAVLLAPVRVASSCVPMYRPIPASLVTPKGATNTSVAVFHHYPNSKLFLRRTPSWPLPCLSCFIFLGRSSNFPACLVIVLLFSLLDAWYRYVCIYVTQVFALECSTRRTAFHHPLNFILDVEGTILVELHTRLCRVYTRPARY